MIGTTAKVLIGTVFLRAADNSDIATFEAPLTEAAFETAFPAATTEYVDGSGEAEYTSAPAATYRAGDANNVSTMTQIPGTLRLTGLTKAELKTFVDTFQNKNVDICIKNSDCGINDLGNGVIFRDVNIWGGDILTRNGVWVYEIQWDKLIPAKKAYEKIQEFDISAT